MNHNSYAHITLDQKGIPMLTGTTMKVIELVLDVQAHGSSPMELHFQFPSLSMGQIHAALAYYWDHKKSLDADIKTRLARIDTLRQQTPVAPFLRKLTHETV